MLTLRDSSQVPRRRPLIYLKPPYAIRSVPSLSGHAIAYRWRLLPRVRRHRASKPQGSSKRVLPWHVIMGQLICASLSHTHWYEVGMWKVPAVNRVSALDYKLYMLIDLSLSNKFPYFVWLPIQFVDIFRQITSCRISRLAAVVSSFPIIAEIGTYVTCARTQSLRCVANGKIIISC